MDVIKMESDSDSLSRTHYQHVMVKEEVLVENQISFIGVKCENVYSEVGPTFPVQELEPNDRAMGAEIMRRKFYSAAEWEELADETRKAQPGDEESDADEIKNETPRSTPTRSSSQTEPSLSTEHAMFGSEYSVAEPTFVPSPFQQINGNGDSPSGDSDSDEENVPYKFVKTGMNPQIFKSFNYDRVLGPNVPVDISSPEDIFLIFFGSILGHIVTQSNLYASQYGVDLHLSIEELKAFLGLLIVMGYHVLPTIRLYWSEDKNFSVLRVSNVMSLRRFLQILRYIHLNDNTKMPFKGQPDYDRFYKLRPLLDHLNLMYKNAFNPSRFLSVDESMVGFKGRATLKQCMPLKPIERGFKVWAVCCAVTGFLVGFQIYEGKTEGTKGERVVLGLTATFQTLGYCLFFGRFFSTIPLMKKLLSKGLFGCGTIQTNRKFYPRNKLCEDRKLKMGEMDYVTSGEISVCKWKDGGKKSVIVVSNMHNPNEMTAVNRKSRTGENAAVPCPRCIYDYNKYKGGVDHFDNLLSCYSISWKSRRWWMKLFYYLFDTAIVNSYILYKTTLQLSSSKEKCMSHLNFRKVLADQLTYEFCSRSKAGQRPQIVITKAKAKKSTGRVVNKGIIMINVGEHLPVKGSCRRCAYCSTKNTVKRSSIECRSCQVSLCLDCFAPFHESQ